jgi:hypothetical protein
MPKAHYAAPRIAQGNLGTQGHSPQENFEIRGPRNGEILHSGSLLTVTSMYILL